MELGKRLYDVDPAKCHVVGMGMEVHESDPTVIPKRLGVPASGRAPLSIASV